MNEKEKNLPEETKEIDTVSGDNQEKEKETGKPSEKKQRTPMSPRTKKRLIAIGIITGAILLVLAAVLIVVSVINNRPPEFAEVRGRFETLLTDSQKVNEMIWGAGLPTYKRVEREIKTFEVDVVKANGDPVTDKDGEAQKKTLRYYLLEDPLYGTIVAYEFQARVNEGKTTEVEVNGQMQTVPVYTIYDVEKGEVLAEYKNGASRFAQRSKTAQEGKTPILEKNGYYYYALPNYENPDLAYAEVYSGKEDEHYDYVRFDQPYKSVDDVKAAADAVYANAFMAPLYESLFTGTVGATNDVHQSAYVDYVDAENAAVYLMKSNTKASGWQWRAPLPEVTFDFSTMQMIDGNAKQVTVTVSYTLAGEAGVKEMEIDFVLENGVWLLNTPTFG